MRPARLPTHLSDSTVHGGSKSICRRRRRKALWRNLLVMAVGAASAVGACVVDGAAVLGERRFNAARSSTPMVEGLGSY